MGDRGRVGTQLKTPPDCFNFPSSYLLGVCNFKILLYYLFFDFSMMTLMTLMHTLGLTMFCYPLLILSILCIYIVICSFILIAMCLLYTYLFEMQSITITDHLIIWTLQNTETYFLLEDREERKIYMFLVFSQVYSSVYTEARGQCWVSCAITCHLVLLIHGLSLNLELGWQSGSLCNLLSLPVTELRLQWHTVITSVLGGC